MRRISKILLRSFLSMHLAWVICDFLYSLYTHLLLNALISQTFSSRFSLGLYVTTVCFHTQSLAQIYVGL